MAGLGPAIHGENSWIPRDKLGDDGLIERPNVFSNQREWQRSIVMAQTAKSFPVLREAVASFADRAHFRRAVSSLLAAGFRHEDVSVLASHQPLAAAEGEPGGIVLISGGPIAVTVAALVGAGLGGAALKELFDDYAAAPHRQDFEAALKAGAALLWVRCDDPELELRATRILEESGGRFVHIHGRPAAPAKRA
jgi:hypothetical protein